jgi:hypothetical protein
MVLHSYQKALRAGRRPRLQRPNGGGFDGGGFDGGDFDFFAAVVGQFDFAASGLVFGEPRDVFVNPSQLNTK